MVKLHIYGMPFFFSFYFKKKKIKKKKKKKKKKENSIGNTFLFLAYESGNKNNGKTFR